MNDGIDWVYSLKPAIIQFLSKLKRPGHPGYYSYSLSGDIYSPETHWGLGNSVFAAKIYYMLNAVDDIQDKKEIGDFIKSFQNDYGEIHDPLVGSRSIVRRIYHSFRKCDFNNIANQTNRRAETRQAFAALLCLQNRPGIPYERIPYTKEEIQRYVTSLNWKEPWGASSHISHLLFFLNTNRRLFDLHKEEVDDLIDHVLALANKYRQEDGSWYSKEADIPLNYKVNSAMKMMTAYEAAGRDDFSYPEKMIDLCLSSANEGDACNNFNIVCVLYHCARKTDYRNDEIREYCLNKLRTFRTHYWPDHGGFSFFERNANSVYYSARISKGLSEPDIHGTFLFLWGITLISTVLRLDKDLCFRVPIT